MTAIDGSIAVVTGAASGIGLALTRGLAAAGSRIVMSDIDGETLARHAADLRAAGAEVHHVVSDVRDAAAVDGLGQVAVDRYGGLHIAVNNAGVVNGGPAWELTVDEWRAVLDVNLWGVIHGIRSFVPRILETGRPGHVVNVASMAAVLPHASLGPYTVAKHGVLGLSDVLRADLAAVGAPIGVSVVLPGAIRTGMNPIGTIEPDVVADNVIDAIRRDRHYVYTDHQATRSVRRRLTAILDARQDVLPTEEGRSADPHTPP